jgi:uncharacterized membrane protein YagU involved in acid resistance
MKPRRGRRALSSVLLGGLVAGVCDITYAIGISYLRRGVPPLRVLQSVASGWLGEEAFQGGVPAGMLGLATHFGIALTAAAIYVLASRRLPFLVRSPLAAGAAYGALIFAFMNLVVIPLSRTPPRTTFSWFVITTGLLVHMFLIGVPIAFAARRAGVSDTP